MSTAVLKRKGRRAFPQQGARVTPPRCLGCAAGGSPRAVEWGPATWAAVRSGGRAGPRTVQGSSGWRPGSQRLPRRPCPGGHYRGPTGNEAAGTADAAAGVEGPVPPRWQGPWTPASAPGAVGPAPGTEPPRVPQRARAERRATDSRGLHSSSPCPSSGAAAVLRPPPSALLGPAARAGHRGPAPAASGPLSRAPAPNWAALPTSAPPIGQIPKDPPRAPWIG